MKRHNTELISALLDGELNGLQRFVLQRHLARCPLCAAEYRHQHHVRQMLAANAPTRLMSDSPEFFWSKIKAEIERRGNRPQQIEKPRLAPLDWLGQHSLATAVAAAVVLCAAAALMWQAHPTREAAQIQAPPLPAEQHLAHVVAPPTTVIANTTATAFQESDEDVTVIWVSGLPWAPNMQEMQTLYANLDT